MSLYTLKREYEERRQALVEQLQRNPSLDPATQHQIYGAIKEIENFLKTIEYQIAMEQEKNINVELASPKPNHFVERTKGAVFHVARGTKRVFTHHIPAAAKKVVSGPKQYFDKKKEEARLRREIEAEIKARHQAQLQSSEHVTLEHPHQELAMHEAPPLPPQAPAQPQPTWNDETVTKAAPAPVAASHEKRPKVIAKSAKSKNHPSKNAPGKKGGQHKPHLKKDKHQLYHRK